MGQTVVSGAEDKATITKRYYDQLDAAGRREMRDYVHRKADVYLAGFMTMGGSSVFLGATYLEQVKFVLAFAFTMGAIATGRWWEQYWKSRDILGYMRNFERSL